MRIEMPVNHHAHPHRETSVKLTVIIQYKTVCVLVTKPTFTKANLLLHRYIVTYCLKVSKNAPLILTRQLQLNTSFIKDYATVHKVTVA